MDIVYQILIYILAVVGIIGSAMPVIPGPLIAFGAVLLKYFTVGEVSITALLLWGAGFLVVSLVDNFLPPIVTKRFGGSKKSSLGSFIGLIVGAFVFPPFGMLLGAFLGALLGEMIESRRLDNKEFRVAFGSFLGVIVGTGIKLIYAVMILVYLIFG